MRRLPFRTTSLIAMLATGVLLAACSDDSGSKQMKSKSTTSTATTTSSSAANDAASCVRGTFRFTGERGHVPLPRADDRRERV